MGSFSLFFVYITFTYSQRATRHILKTEHLILIYKIKQSDSDSLNYCYILTLLYINMYMLSECGNYFRIFENLGWESMKKHNRWDSEMKGLDVTSSSHHQQY